MPTPELMPSAVCATRAQRVRLCRTAMAAGATMIHVDLFDPAYCSSFDGTTDSSLDALAAEGLPIEVHLLTAAPLVHLARLIAVRPRRVFIQAEVADLAEVVDAFCAADLPVGLAFTLDDALERGAPFAGVVTRAMLFGSRLGERGASAPDALRHRMRRVREILTADDGHVSVAIDGGVTLESAEWLAAAGADALVVGSLCFGRNGDDNPARTLGELRRAFQGEGIASMTPTLEPSHPSTECSE